MKRLTLFGLIAFVFASCVVENYEPAYDERDRLVGSYDVEEYSETYNDYTRYSIRISKAPYRREVYLHNFYAANITILAVVNYDKITIPYQVVDGYQVEGVGTVYGDELNLSYGVKDRINGYRTDFCETVAWFDY